MSTVGGRLRQARERRVMSQEDLARAADVTEATISRIENDRYGPPRPSTIRKLAGALNVEPGWLLFGEDQEVKLAA